MNNIIKWTKENLNDYITDIANHGAIGGLFNCMEEAELVIEATKKKHPDRQEYIQDFFRYCRPGDMLRGRGMRLYIRHLEQLMQIYLRGGDMTLPTPAELCCVFSDSSMVAPLNTDGTIAYQEVFKKTFPELCEPDGWPQMHETWDGAALIALSQVRNRSKQADRDCRRS